MNITSLFTVVLFSMVTWVESSSLDCSFDGRRSFCQWQREWFGMRRAGWRSGRRLKKINLLDHTTERGKFIYFLSKSRPAGFRSRIRSPTVIPPPNSCFVFWLSMGGSKVTFPVGNSMLKLYVVGEDAPVETATPVWTQSDRTVRLEGFKRVVIPVAAALQTAKSLSVQFVLEAIRGGSKRTYVAIDDVSLQECEKSRDVNGTDLLDVHEEAQSRINDMKKDLERLMLPARRSNKIGIIRFQDSFSGVAVAPSNDGEISNGVVGYPTEAVRAEHALVRFRSNSKKNRRHRKGRKGRKSRRGRKKKRKERPTVGSFGNVIIEGSLRQPLHHVHDVHLSPPNSETACDFIEYTLRLHRCFRSFFSMLRKRPKTCVQRYVTLESCLRTSARSCVSSRVVDQPRLEELIIGSVRNNFMTEQVFCQEEGAFVYPEFAVAKLPIQCGDRYFIKLSQCSSSFNNVFKLRHGNPKLCKEYYQANECQRRTTAEECNFDAETMLLYGLNLQYQFAHNPFCIHLPFSSWWPES